jgi:hypothetical protein
MFLVLKAADLKSELMRTGLLLYIINYGHEQFYDTGTRGLWYKKIYALIVALSY